MKILDEMYNTIVLSEEEVAECLKEIGWVKIIDAVEETFIEEAKGNVESPPKVIIDIPRFRNDYRTMPSYMHKYPEYIGTKMVSACPGNVGTGYAFAMGSYILNDARVQKPLLICGARTITAYRTAAATAVAVRHLSDPDSDRLGIIGCGVQANFHIPAICAVRPIDKILVNDINEECADHLIEGECGSLAEKASVTRILRECDVVVTLTPTTEPFIFKENIPDLPMLICGVGGDSERKLEFDPEVLRTVDHYCDSYEQASHTGIVHRAVSRFLITKDDLKSLGDYMIGARPADDSLPVKMFLSTGVALEDLAMAILLYNKLK